MSLGDPCPECGVGSPGHRDGCERFAAILAEVRAVQEMVNRDHEPPKAHECVRCELCSAIVREDETERLICGRQGQPGAYRAPVCAECLAGIPVIRGSVTA